MRLICYNRMVVNADKYSIVQTNHYYPYGGIIGNLSSNQEEQKFKFGGKELERFFGLDWYDFHARQYDPVVPSFTSVDPLTEKYYGISPYAYCAGDPVNSLDPDGKEVVFANKEIEAKFNEARAYLQSIGASRLLDALVDSKDVKVLVKMPQYKSGNGSGGEYFNSKERFGEKYTANDGVISWNPEQASVTADGYVMSPVEILNHEADHAVLTMRNIRKDLI